MSRPFSFSPETSSFRLPFEASGDGFLPTWYHLVPQREAARQGTIRENWCGNCKWLSSSPCSGINEEISAKLRFGGRERSAYLGESDCLARECTEQAGILNLLQEAAPLLVSSFSTSRWTLPG